MLNTRFPSESLKFWYVPCRACLCSQAPMKILDTEFLTSSPGCYHFTCTVTARSWGINGFCDSTGKRILGNIGLVFPEVCPVRLFFLLILLCIVLLWVLPVNPWTLEGGLILESGNTIETEENNFIPELAHISFCKAFSVEFWVNLVRNFNN